MTTIFYAFAAGFSAGLVFVSFARRRIGEGLIALPIIVTLLFMAHDNLPRATDPAPAPRGGRNRG